MGNGTRAQLVDVERLGYRRDPNIEVPEVSDEEFLLLDDDSGYVTTINRSQVMPYLGATSYAQAFVDNIVSLQIRMPDIWGDIVNETLSIIGNGWQYDVTLNSIDSVGGAAATMYLKSNGVIFPVDDNKNVLLNKTNCPNLAYIKDFVLEAAQEINERRLEIAYLAWEFVRILGAYGQAKEFVNGMTSGA